MTAPASTSRSPRPVAAAAAAVLALAAVAGLAVIVVGWTAGWRVHDMTTPSMGTAAPVGAVVVSRPTPPAGLHVSDIVVFHPPGRPLATYAHRVVAVTTGPDGQMIRTKGDINSGPDPWTVVHADVIGRVVTVVPDLGFLLQALPLLLLGTFAILLLTAGLGPVLRRPLRLAGGSLLVAMLIFHFRPLERVVMVDQDISGGHGTATLVPTGILPLRVQAVGGSHVSVDPGQVAVVHLAHLLHGGAFRITTRLHLSGWWWATLAVLAVPLVIGLALDGANDVA